MLKIKNFLKYAKCLNCNKEFLLFNTYKVNNKEYVCRNCSTQKSYYAKNEAKKGKDTQMTFSFEFETGERNNELFELLKYGFIGLLGVLMVQYLEQNGKALYILIVKHFMLFVES